MQIPFLDLKRQYEEIEDEVTASIEGVLKSGAYIVGSEVEAFEQEWARFCGVGGAAGVGSGTDALILALKASGGIREGHNDEVITTPLTAGYTALAIAGAGGVPVFADINPQTLTLDPEALEKAITPRTRAIVPVHLYGQMCEMQAICDVASRYGLIVIEDAAQAHGAFSGGKRAGAHGHAAAFSFYPTKNLGAYGDGGAVTSNDLKLIEQVKVLRQGGHAFALQTNVTGHNSRLDEIQAAVLRVKLKYLEASNKCRKRLASIYRELLSGGTLKIPVVRDIESHVFHLYVVQHPERERLRADLAAQGIETMIHYPFLLHQQPLFRSGAQRPLPVAESVAGKIFSLPLYPQLSEAEARRVAQVILNFEATV